MIDSNKFHSDLEKKVFQQLVNVGWLEKDILREVKTNLKGGRFFTPDFVLTYQLYPLVVVEVSNSARISDAKEQILPLIEESEIGFGLVTDGNYAQCFSLNFPDLVFENGKLPSPQDLLGLLKLDLNSGDPRFATSSTQQTSQMRWHQLMAIKQLLDAVIVNRKRIWLSLAQGAGKHFILSCILPKLLTSGYSHKVLILNDRLDLQHQLMAYPFRELQEVYGFSHITTKINSFNPNASVFFAMPRAIQEIVDVSHVKPVVANDFFDLIIVWSERYIDSWSYVLDYFSEAQVIAVTNPIQNKTAYNTFMELMGEPVFAYSTREYVENILVQPPTGYYSISLGSIAEFRSGLSKVKYEEGATEVNGTQVSLSLQTDSVNIFSAAMINSDGTINFDKSYKLLVTESQNQLLINKYDLVTNDIVISKYAGQDSNRIIFVSEDISGKYFIDNSVIRIRVTYPELDAHQIYKFLCSDVGQSYLGNVRSQTTLPTISIAMLNAMPVFLSEDKQKNTNTSKEFTASGRAIYEIRNNILPLLLEIEKSSDGLNGKLQTVAELLTRVASTLVPLSLEQKVLSGFPTPVALAYSRFLKARFNAFEQVRRLIDLTESIQFFVYNTLLSEFLRRPKTFYVEDAGARRAFNGYSMTSRMDFVKAIQSIAKANKVTLFINELADSFDAELARELTDQLRNRTAHTATAPESQQRKVLDTFRPRVEDLLNQLDFLRNYSLVQIPSFHRRNGKLYRRVHIFRGIDPIFEEQEFDNLALTEADSDHLVLLNSEDDALDLYPLYQLIASEETRFESHICFMKQRKQKESTLEGESIQGTFALKLDGFDYFEQLQATIVNTPTKE